VGVCTPEPPGTAPSMGIGTSIFLIAAGAIARWAVTADVEGVNLDTLGLVLMVVGGIGLVLSLFWMTMWADRRRGTVVERDVVADRPVVRERDVV
jgi:Domain of unknown function (DUF6458)